jgi:hypothetical protein
MSASFKNLRDEAIDTIWEECLEKGICPACYLDDDYQSEVGLTNNNNEPRFCNECGFQE